MYPSCPQLECFKDWFQSVVFLWSTYTKPWGYQKNDYWASCKTSCTEGIDPTDPPEFATPWTCKAPEMLTCLQSLQSVGLGRDLFEPFLPNFRSLLHWEPRWNPRNRSFPDRCCLRRHISWWKHKDVLPELPFATNSMPFSQGNS